MGRWQRPGLGWPRGFSLRDGASQPSV
jgi:hypothetical protein